jgi:hypothetical protein
VVEEIVIESREALAAVMAARDPAVPLLSGPVYRLPTLVPTRTP